MTKLKININFNSNCILSIQDTTGFGGANGFVIESGTPTLEGDYKLSNGVFIDTVIYNPYNRDTQILNPLEEVISLTTSEVKPVYADNFETKYYTLAKDGVYTFKRAFVITKAYYLANIGNITKTAYYYDPETGFYYNSANEVVELKDLVLLMGNDTTGSITSYKFISTCYLNKCLFKLQTEILSKGLEACNGKGDIYKKQRDYIVMTLNVINYLKEDGHLNEVQKVIESSNSCGLICKQINGNNGSDCGCG